MATLLISQLTTDADTGEVSDTSQSFTTVAGQSTVTTVLVWWGSLAPSGGAKSITGAVYSGTTFGVGDLLGSKVIGDPWPSVYMDFTFDSPISVSPATGYYFKVTLTAGYSSGEWLKTVASSYPGGECDTGGDLKFSIYGDAASPSANFFQFIN